MRKPVRRILLVFGATLVSVLALTPGVAHAAVRLECTAFNADVCTTGSISANAKSHSVYMWVDSWYGSDRATCVVWDDHTWVEVGRLTTARSAGKRISGLYGTYVMGCYTTNDAGAAHGTLDNF